MDSTIAVVENMNSTINNLETCKKTGLGERLKKAREAMQLTQKEAAARLHLNVNMIILIENESFDHAPPRAFIRGYVGCYGRLLNLSEHEMIMTMQELDSVIPSSDTATPSMQPANHRTDERYVHWLTYLIIWTLGVLVSIWWHSHGHYIITNVPTAISTVESVPPIVTAVSAVPAAATPLPLAAVKTTAAPPSTMKAAPTFGVESDDQDDNNNDTE